MPATFINMATVLVGSLIGIFFRNRIREKYIETIFAAIALCTAAIGIMSAVKTSHILIVIVCLVIGSVIGEALRIDDRIENAGTWLNEKLFRGREGNSRFAEGFVSASVLFCVGSMTIMGSLEAGIRGDYSIILAKSVMDLISSMAFGAAMGIGVTFSVLFILVYQGGITLLAGLAAPYLSDMVVTEMSAVGGVMLIGMAVNMLELSDKRIRLANMLPAIFLPIIYFPLAELVKGLF
ncbi:MAG: DUF554 domain-containing protein [Oscillospiraceae bacterium]|nr:DUF554 domain-containing protein [Oscillospiraceae bacterium]